MPPTAKRYYAPMKRLECRVRSFAVKRLKPARTTSGDLVDVAARTPGTKPALSLPRRSEDEDVEQGEQCEAQNFRKVGDKPAAQVTGRALVAARSITRERAESKACRRA
jgi:hypothetical protein